MDRRTFLGATASTAVLLHGSVAPPDSQRLPIKKGVLFGMLPENLSFQERFELAKDVGFEEMECPTIRSSEEAEAIREAATKTGIRVHSVMNSDHWTYPLSSENPDDVARSVECMEVSLRNAHLWGADTVLLVPAVVNPQTRYEEAWRRSQDQIRKLIPLAKELRVVIAVENVWNKFLLSPMEFARYVDDFGSPWVKAYFDVGNVVLFGYPQDWIVTLKERIVKLHLKDFRFGQDPVTKKRVAEFVPLREGDIDWKAIYTALRSIGYRGTATVEVRGGGREELAEISRRVDLIFSNA